MATSNSKLTQLWEKADRPGVRAFFLSMTALGVALVLALYSGAAAQLGNVALASASALTALLVAAWVGVTLVPVLAKRTPLRWIGYKMEYKVTREGWIYIAGIILVALAALNTGNNLLFLVLASLIASILMSGILSSITLAGVELGVELPEHIFAGSAVRGAVELRNEKWTLPSFSLRVEGVKPGKQADAAMLQTPVFFPYLPKNEVVRQAVPLVFPRRGVYRQEAFRIVTRFPFGFLQKARRLDMGREALVYPSVETTPEFLEILQGLNGAMETLAKGRGQDLYALRDYMPNDSVRHVHWKASARLGSLMVREFARESDTRVVLVFDTQSAAARATATEAEKERFEQAVNLCAAIAWELRERQSLMEFRSAESRTEMGPAEESVFEVLRALATVKPTAPRANFPLFAELGAQGDTFKIVVTSQPRGTIPPALWNSSYIVFAEETA